MSIIIGLGLLNDARARASFWRGKRTCGGDALYVILGLKSYKDGQEKKLNKFIKAHVPKLSKADMIEVLNELERQGEFSLALKVFGVIQKQCWYEPDVYLYKNLIVALSKSKKMKEVMEVWEAMRGQNLFPDCQTYSEVIRGFLRCRSPVDALSIYEDMKKSPDPPEELPFRILLTGLRPYPVLRKIVKKDFEAIFPDRHIYDTSEEI